MRYAAVASLAIVIAGCATITKGTTQIVAIDTPGVPGADCVVQTAAGALPVTTPGTITLNKGNATLPVKCTKRCFQDGLGVIPPTVEVMTAGNLVAGGVIGIGVDAVTGAMHRYPDHISVVMIPVQGCGAPPSAKRR